MNPGARFERHSAAVAEGRAARLARLRELIDRRGLGALVLRRPANFAWYTGGADSRVDHVSPYGVADLLITADAEYVVTNAIEAPRMREEQTPELEVAEYPWQEDSRPLLDELANGGRLGADFALAGAEDVAPEIAGLRFVLDPDAIERLRVVGRDTTAALAAAAGSVRAGVSERELAANLAGACKGRGLQSSVLLVGADGRIASFRHPLPADAVVKRRALLAVSAERWGLYANVTEIVELEPRDRELERRAAACEQILERMREEATRPGRTLADAFADCRRFYAEAGFPDEWRLHHQGGMTGYGSREVIATPDTEHRIVPGQAFAWNPSVTGAKAEETFLLTESGPEIVAGARVASTSTAA
jgi:Xaa-Pro aminopeptidase